MNPNTIHCGDSIELLNAAEPGFADLVFADPPYNIGYVYDNYTDDVPDRQYVDWSKRWMAACSRALRPSGSMYIAIGDDFAADLRIAGRELGLHLRNWIIWHYTFGQNARTKFGRAHTHILYFVKDRAAFTFNDKLLRYPSARHTEYQDLRADPLGRVYDDVWCEIPRVCGTFKERAGVHGCQLPEALLMRIILASSSPGDVVLDPFVGSGTTAVAAARLGRRYVGIDLSPTYVNLTTERLARSAREDADWAAPGWTRLATDMLLQLYRDTKVAWRNLRGNQVALRVLTASLNARCETAHSVDDVRTRLDALSTKSGFPKLLNDREFAPRSHVKSEGKRYERRVLRNRSRRTAESAGAVAR